MTRPKRASGPGRSKRDSSGEDAFELHCRAVGLPDPERQFVMPRSDGELTKAGKLRVWRFDFAWPDRGLIVEIDGGVWTRGAHGHPVDLVRNMAKRNDAALAGFAVLAFTPQQVKAGQAVQFTERMLDRWQPTITRGDLTDE